MLIFCLGNPFYHGPIKETDSMLMLKKVTARRDLLGFRLNTYGMDLGEYTFSEH
jgi:hypothetical protein